MIVWIDEDEVFPVYVLSFESEIGFVKVDVPDSVVEKWKNVLRDYSFVQKEMKYLLNEALKRRSPNSGEAIIGSILFRVADLI